MLTVLLLVQTALLAFIIGAQWAQSRRSKAIREKLDRATKLLREVWPPSRKEPESPRPRIEQLSDEELDAMEDRIYREREMRKPRRW